MSARIIYRNRIVWRSLSDLVTHAFSEVPTDRFGQPVDCASAIPSSSPCSPFRDGYPVTLDDGITYRCVRYLDPLQGWAPMEFWVERWFLPYREVLRFVERGLLDAAVEEGSALKRYRCRDEYALKESKEFKSAIWKIRQRKKRVRPLNEDW